MAPHVSLCVEYINFESQRCISHQAFNPRLIFVLIYKKSLTSFLYTRWGNINYNMQVGYCFMWSISQPWPILPTRIRKTINEFQACICNHIRTKRQDEISTNGITPNFNGGLIKPSLKSGHRWVIITDPKEGGNKPCNTWYQLFSFTAILCFLILLRMNLI